MTSHLTHKEMTAHIRGRIKAAKIDARVSLYTACGSMWIRVTPVKADLSFSGEEAYQIALIAQVNDLTRSRGQPIDLDGARFGATNFHFVFWGDKPKPNIPLQRPRAFPMSAVTA